MKYMGYLTLIEAEELSGIKADTLKKRCQEGRIAGAIKQGKTWFVPESEIVKRAGSVDDTILQNFALAAHMHMTFPVTVMVKGAVISGNLISMERFGELTLETMEQGVVVDQAGTRPDKETLDSFSKAFKLVLGAPPARPKKDEDQIRRFNFLHLDKVALQMGSSFSPLKPAALRIRIDSVDGFWYGSANPELAV
jgi:hypothetical protein